MNKSESKYFNTAVRMDEALLELLEIKELEYITVKEICQRAGVSRSTFYLHYETIGELLDECVKYKIGECYKKFDGGRAELDKNIRSGNLDELVFVTPEYLKPYLEFVRENKRFFKICVQRPSALNADRTFAELFKDVFSPVLDCFRLPDESKPYVINFYMLGLIAVVSEWIKRGCDDPIDKIIEICMLCVLPGEKRLLLSRIKGGEK